MKFLLSSSLQDYYINDVNKTKKEKKESCKRTTKKQEDAVGQEE